MFSSGIIMEEEKALFGRNTRSWGPKESALMTAAAQGGLYDIIFIIGDRARRGFARAVRLFTSFGRNEFEKPNKRVNRLHTQVLPPYSEKLARPTPTARTVLSLDKWRIRLDVLRGIFTFY